MDYEEAVCQSSSIDPRAYGMASGLLAGRGPINARDADPTPTEYLIKQAEYFKQKAAQTRHARAQLEQEAERCDQQARAFLDAAAKLQLP